MAIFLNITDGNGKQRVRVTGKALFIGRSQKCHITLSDSLISGKHLAIKINNDNRVVIKDLGTTNGTYLNGSKIDESFLYTEDFIQIGNVKIELDDSEMSTNEKKNHERDFERTNVTFVRLGAVVEGFDDLDEDEFGAEKQKTLLAKIRKMKEKENQESNTSQTAATKEAPKSKSQSKKSPQKKPTQKNSEEHEDDSSDATFVGRIKGLFKK